LNGPYTSTWGLAIKRKAGLGTIQGEPAVAWFNRLVAIPRPTASADELVPRGPVFAVDVMFMQDADPLWGQADFFATFAINFERPEFTLRY